MKASQVVNLILYSVLALLVSAVPTLLVVLGFPTAKMSPVVFILLAWLLVNLASLLQLFINALIVLGYVILFVLGDDDDLPN